MTVFANSKPGTWSVTLENEVATAGLGAELALFLTAGDVLELSGDLGAGKTTLARAIINALAPAGELIEVPSPTFTLLQPYDQTRVPVSHFDFYRLQSAEEIYELGLDDAMERSAVLMEWATRLGEHVPEDRLSINLAIGHDENVRLAVLTGHGAWVGKLARLVAAHRFISDSSYASCDRMFFQGDASSRRYERLAGPGGKGAIFMDMPPRSDAVPIRNGKPYSEIAHIADDVVSFAALAEALNALGLSAPKIYTADLEQGFLLIEDFGDDVFGSLDRGSADSETAYEVSCDVLVELAVLGCPVECPVEGAEAYHVPPYDDAALHIETELLLDWFWPLLQKDPLSPAERREFHSLWQSAFARLDGAPPVWALRDYHSPNLMWLPKRSGVRRIGLLDFQDAVMGPPAYDLVSLLQDARIDVPQERESRYYTHYVTQRGARDPAFEAEAFALDYAIMGAQRATKILGIFARLKARDGKPHYLRHLPRVSEYLERNLKHPRLHGLKVWFDLNLPHEDRKAEAARREAGLI